MARAYRDILRISQLYWDRLRLGLWPLTMAGTLRDILRISQWYWDRLRLGLWPSYYGWDIKGYSQNLPMILGQIKTGIVALLLCLGH